MQGIVVTLAAILGIALVGMVLVQGFSRRVDLFSMRNLYIASFIVYQIGSPALALYTNDFNLFTVYSPEQTGMKYLLFLYVYMGVFLLSYHRLDLTPRIARRWTGIPIEINDSVLLGLATLMVCIAAPLRLFGPSIPLVASVSIQTSIAICAVANAIAGWVWGNRRFNLAVVIAMIFIVGTGLTISMYGAFGRRPLLSVLLGFASGAYHRRIKLMRPAKLVAYLVPLVLFVAVMVSAFTAIRSHRLIEKQGLQGTFQSMKQASIGEGAGKIATGQACGAAMLWCIENFPGQFETKYFYSLQVMACWYIPSHLWEDKPLPLGNFIARYAKVDGVNRKKITLPPGVLGYSAAEGGLLAVIVYALFYGQFLRFFDELVRLNPFNPLIILPAGCATGQVLGLARGDIGVFANLVILGFVSTFVILYVAGKMFGRRAAPAYYTPWPVPR